MIKLLCVTGDIFPPKTGGDQAVFNAIRLLSSHVEMHVMVVGNHHPQTEKLVNIKNDLSLSDILYYNIKNKDKYEFVHQTSIRFKKLLQKLFGVQKDAINRELQLGVNLERNFRMYESINNYVRNNHIDIVQFEFGSSLFWAQGVLPGVKTVYVQHEIQYVVEKQRLPINPSTEDMLHWNICRRREIAMQNMYDAVITLSDEDKSDCQKDGVVVPVFASFAKVETRNYTSFVYDNKKEINLVFVGPEQHLPNKHGLKWFLDNVWPQIVDSYPHLLLKIVGKWSEVTATAWSSSYKNIVFLGFVDDLPSALQGNIMIVPIFEGSGIRMKILEAAYMCVPFISTTVGARGLGFVHNKTCVISDEAKDFTSQLNRMLNHPEMLNDMVSSALQHVHEYFSDNRFISSRMKCYESVVSSTSDISNCRR